MREDGSNLRISKLPKFLRECLFTVLCNRPLWKHSNFCFCVKKVCLFLKAPSIKKKTKRQKQKTKKQLKKNHNKNTMQQLFSL